MNFPHHRVRFRSHTIVRKSYALCPSTRQHHIDPEPLLHRTNASINLRRGREIAVTAAQKDAVIAPPGLARVVAGRVAACGIGL
jgi:hypothetical protein